MKFDAERATALAKRFGFPRHAGTDGERRAADMLEEELERAGLRVERRPIRTPSRSIPLSLLLQGGYLWLGLWMALPAMSPVARAGLVALGLAALPAADQLRRLASRDSGSYRSEHVIGTRPAGESPAVRVVVLTALTTPIARRVVAVKLALAIAGVGFWGILAVPWAEGVPWSPGAGLGLLLGSWASLLLVIAIPEDRAAGPSTDDNRTGLACLVELARSWPSRHDDRVEVRFVATREWAFGARDLVRIAREEWPSKPTSVINLEKPGVGGALVLAGPRVGRDLAAAAARDLWLPFRASKRKSWYAPASDWFESAGMAYVSLRGELRAAPIDPAALSSAAQLATELALRWARRGGAVARVDERASS
jgi:hypothetical protein